MASLAPVIRYFMLLCRHKFYVRVYVYFCVATPQRFMKILIYNIEQYKIHKCSSCSRAHTVSNDGKIGFCSVLGFACMPMLPTLRTADGKKGSHFVYIENECELSNEQFMQKFANSMEYAKI